ncbi:MAG TPA: DUF4342 domain-containing protein [Myxococcaceae bacterium]|nr:DUF4342 domain-containing protein [Myxococcaceae bacterium]
MADTKGVVEQLEVASDKLVETIKGLIHEGNIQRVTVKNPEGRVLLDLPLTAGIVGVLLLTVWATLGTIAALAGGFKVQVERTPEAKEASDARKTGPTAPPEQP